MTDETLDHLPDEGSPSGSTIKEFYLSNGATPGADFFVVGPGSVARSGELAALLTALRNGDGPLVREVVIFLPPGRTETMIRTRVEAAFVRQVVELFDDARRPETGVVRLPSCVRFESLASFDAEELLGRIRDARHPAAFVVPEAARYRASLALPEGAQVPEDLWVPELHALGGAVVKVVVPRGSYAVLDADEWWPEREGHRELLLAVDGCGVANANCESTPALTLLALRERWVELARTGQLETALDEIARRPDLPVAQRIYARMSAFNEAGYVIETIAEFAREKGALDARKGEEALAFVPLAVQAGRPDLAHAMLTRAIPDLGYAESLQMGLRLADELADERLVEVAEMVLRERHPRSPLLLDRDVRRLVSNGRRIEAAELLEAAGNAAATIEAGYLRWLGVGLEVDPFDTSDLLATCRASFPRDLARTQRAIAAKLEGTRPRAEGLDLLLAGSGEDGVLERADVLALLGMLERGTLALDATCDSDMAVAVIGAAVRWLSRNPLDGTIRLKVADLLSPQMIGGVTSTAIIAMVCIRLGERDVGLRPSVALEDRPKPCDYDLLPSIMERGLAHVAQLPAAVLGRVRFPVDELSVPADEAVAGFVGMLDHAGIAYGDRGDAEVIENLLLVATSLAAVGTQPDADLLLLRTAGGRLALHGMAQRARDLAEHALNVAGSDPHRIRVAWYSFADLYHRSGDMIDALLGYACALAADDAVDVDQVWYESHLGIRLFRDIGLHALLPRLIALARAALARAGLAYRRAHWLDTIELQVRFSRLDRRALDAGELDALMRATAANLRTVMLENDDAGPATMLLASMARVARDAGIPIPTDVGTVIDEGRGRLGPATLALLTVATDPNPDEEELARLAAAIDAARYADDVGFDLRYLAIGAKRLLGSALIRPETAAFAIEIMSDLGLPMVGGRA